MKSVAGTKERPESCGGFVGAQKGRAEHRSEPRLTEGGGEARGAHARVLSPCRRQRGVEPAPIQLTNPGRICTRKGTRPAGFVPGRAGISQLYRHSGVVSPCRVEPVWGTHPPTRWNTTLSSKVNLPHAINLRANCGASLVT